MAGALTLPTILIVVGVIVIPLLYAGWLSVHKVGPNPRAERPFIGLENYVTAIESRTFRASLGSTIYFAVVSIAVQTPLGLAIALLLNEEFRGRNIVRALILIPWAIPTIVNGVLWEWIYNASYGALNGLLFQFGLIDQPVLWLGAPLRAMNMVIVADTWKVLPFYAILFLAGLQTIPNDLYDASTVDGAAAVAKLRHIIFPFLKPFLLVILILRTMETFRVFDIIYTLTKGGPAGGTTVIAYHAYRVTFESLKFGLGAALAFMIGFATLILAAVYLRVLRSD